MWYLIFIIPIGYSLYIPCHKRPIGSSFRMPVQMLSKDSIPKIIKSKNYVFTEPYNGLMDRIQSGKVQKIYFEPKMDEVITLDKPIVENQYLEPELMDYRKTPIAPAIASQLTELSARNSVETIFLHDPTPTTNSISMMASKVLDLSIPLFFVIVVLSIIRNIAMGIQGSGIGGPMGLMQKGEFGEVIDPEDLKRGNISLASFSGSPEILQECEEVVSFLRNESAYKLCGAEIPRGILLEGSPGTGKTLLAKSIAAECEASFISVASSEFVELFVGMGANKVRQLFENARENRPCIIFIDEIDAVGKKRGQGLTTNDEREQTLNQLLVEMDGFADNEGILVMAATNRRDVLDPALLRPGRFDRIITVPLPDRTSRISILELYAKNKRLDKSVDLSFVADLTSGFSGAELKNIMNEAAIFSIRQKEKNKGVITNTHILNAIDKSIIGIIKVNDTRNMATLMRVAIHETGHALIAALYPEYFDLKKVSIQSTYSGTGGYTIFVEHPNITEGGLYTRDVLYKRLIIAMGGKAAESIYYGDDHVSLGAIQDLKTANDLARKMVGNYGMGDDLKVFYKDDNEAYSQETMRKYDEEMQELMTRAYAEAKHLLSKQMEEINFFVNRLIVETTIICTDQNH